MKVIFKAIFLWIATTLSYVNVSAQCDYSGDITSLPTLSSWNDVKTATITTPEGWKWRACYHPANAPEEIQLNGGKSDGRRGRLTLPVFSSGCSAIHFSYKKYQNECKGFTVEVTQGTATLFTETIAIPNTDKDRWLEFSKDNLTIEGDFQIIITNTTNGNNSPNYGVAVLKSFCITANPTSLQPPALSFSGAHPRTEGGYWDAATVSLSHELESVAIYYTTDGAEPTAASTRYTAPFEVAPSTRVRAIAVREALTSAEVDSTVAVAPTTFSFVAPKEATVFVGAKDQTVFVASHYLTMHYIPFTERQPAYT
ncbi:MAG: chitobiase/beta-hexosaminidase C-terminal domain-containing protein, partial [Prevotellaceae bacterium]|nr:chitobiase/beta-hexosaminidase C-terminal domain-containing protein [Prevotellaceae bacterium]